MTAEMAQLREQIVSDCFRERGKDAVRIEVQGAEILRKTGQSDEDIARKVRDAANGKVMDLVVRQLTKEDHVVVAEQRKQKRSGFAMHAKWIAETDSDSMA